MSNNKIKNNITQHQSNNMKLLFFFSMSIFVFCLMGGWFWINNTNNSTTDPVAQGLNLLYTVLILSLPIIASLAFALVAIKELHPGEINPKIFFKSLNILIVILYLYVTIKFMFSIDTFIISALMMILLFLKINQKIIFLYMTLIILSLVMQINFYIIIALILIAIYLGIVRPKIFS